MLQPGIHKQRYRITCRQVLHAPAGLAATTAAVAANGTAAPADAAVQLLRDSNGTTFEAYEMEHMFHVAALKGTVSEMDIFNWVAPHRKYLGAKVSQRKTLQVRSAMSACFASISLRCEMMMPWPDVSSRCNGVSGVRAGLCTMHSAWPSRASLGLCMHAHISMQSQCIHAHFLVDQRCIMQQLYEDLMAGVPAGRQALGAAAQASDKANEDAAFTRSADAVLVGDRWLGRLVAAGVQLECMHCLRAVPASFTLLHRSETASLDSFGACACLALINMTSWVAWLADKFGVSRRNCTTAAP